MEVEVKLSGLPSKDLEALAEESLLLMRDDEPVDDRIAVERLAALDRGMLRKLLESRAYYGADISVTTTFSENAAVLAFDVSPGNPYLLADISFDYGANTDDRLPYDIEAFDLYSGMTAKAAPLKELSGRLVRRLQELGYPEARIVRTRFISNADIETIDGELAIETGPLVTLGSLRFEGLERVNEGYLRRLVSWQPGGLYDPARLTRVRRALSATGLFKTIVVDLHPEGAPGADTPVLVRLEERPHRALSAGLSYSTDEGVSAHAAWRHRNFGGEGEVLTTEVEGGGRRQEASAEYRVPNFRSIGQTLTAESILSREDDDAFEEIGIENILVLSWPVAETLTLTLGPTLTISQVDDGRTSDLFTLLGLVGSARYDSTDDLLNPTKGARVAFQSAPAGSVLGERVAFWSNDFAASTYIELLREGRLVFATRGRLGSIVGAERDDIPATHRLYAGGGGSIRGFGFRDVGPIDPDGDPIGGRSVIETSAELRFRFLDDYGLVPFIDGGQVFEAVIPDFSGEYRWAAGLGLRYFSPIGPVRLDVGFPLNGRESDDDFQLYISVGQAF
ncbi:MAG: BamA/TamA family outer membrane protein [Alphaproteobacteria bacterium]|nr:BamA/TamA family outer membrane protein [Alphaproteobacteria bacterium]